MTRHSIITIDTQQVRPRMAASHLLIIGNEAAFIDAGTNHSATLLLEELRRCDITREAVKYVVLTHVHLDHAGGAGRLLQLLPDALACVHPRGAPHLLDPQRLEAATRQVYGDAVYDAQYGALIPVPKTRLRTLADGETLDLGGVALTAIHTPGHAMHHLCLVDPVGNCVFTGDTFGIRYPELIGPTGDFIFPTTTPTQFDPLQLHASVERVRAVGVNAAYLTHFGRVEQLGARAAELHQDIDIFVDIARRHGPGPDAEPRIAAALFEHLSARLERHGFVGGLDERHRLLDMDITLNAAGLVAWLARSTA